MKNTELTVKFTTQFKKDYKLAVKKHMNMQLLYSVIESLANRKPLPEKLRDHSLTGSWSGYRECHIHPDWLLIYRVDGDVLVLTLARTGSHSDLF